MPSPFPGMDPYLEHPALWPGLHQLLIARILGTLNIALPQKYVANINERGEAGEVREPFIEILPVADQSRVVAIVEVLSPTNKEGGKGRDLYLTKQRETLRSQAHLLEIDLLRGGQHTVAVPLNQLLLHGGWHSLVCLHRARGPRFEVWPMPLEHRLPRVAVPLSDGDPDVVLDIKDLFSRCYDEAAYQRRINYNEEPLVRLPPAAAQWLDAVLREAGLRPQPTGESS